MPDQRLHLFAIKVHSCVGDVILGHGNWRPSFAGDEGARFRLVAANPKRTAARDVIDRHAGLLKATQNSVDVLEVNNCETSIGLLCCSKGIHAADFSALRLSISFCNHRGRIAEILCLQTPCMSAISVRLKPCANNSRIFSGVGARRFNCCLDFFMPGDVTLSGGQCQQRSSKLTQMSSERFSPISRLAKLAAGNSSHPKRMSMCHLVRSLLISSVTSMDSFLFLVVAWRRMRFLLDGIFHPLRCRTSGIYRANSKRQIHLSAATEFLCWLCVSYV